jgi:N-acetylneuraminic acid mutarotase
MQRSQNLLAVFLGFAVALALVVASEGLRAGRAAPPMPGKWRQLPDGPASRAEAPGAVVDGKLFVFGGFRGLELAALRRVDVLDPETGHWTSAAPLPAPVTHVFAVVVGRQIWVAGGFVGDHPGTATEAVWIYEVDGDTWAPGPQLPAPRAGGGFVRLGETLHYFGGLVDRSRDAGEHWALTPGPEQRWEPRAPLPEPRNHLGAAALDGMIYAVGGQHGHDESRRDVDSVHIYDAARDTWRAGAALPSPRSHFETAIVEHRGKLVIVGGRSETPRAFYETPLRRADLAVPEIHLYDPETDRWSALPGLPTGLLGATVGRIRETFVVVGGSIFMAGFTQDDVLAGEFPFSF